MGWGVCVCVWWWVGFEGHSTARPVPTSRQGPCRLLHSTRLVLSALLLLLSCGGAQRIDPSNPMCAEGLPVAAVHQHRSLPWPAPIAVLQGGAAHHAAHPKER